MSSPSQPSKFARIQTWLALGLLLLMLALGIAWYGFSLEVHHRFWHNIAGRLEGPMTFRFILQPTMAFIAALADGIRDVKAGHKSFFWTKVDDPAAPARPPAGGGIRHLTARAARAEHGHHLPVQGARPFLSGRGLRDGDPARHHSVFRLPLDASNGWRAGGWRASPPVRRREGSMPAASVPFPLDIEKVSGMSSKDAGGTLFEDAPLTGLQKRLGLLGTGRLNVGRRALLVSWWAGRRSSCLPLRKAWRRASTSSPRCCGRSERTRAISSPRRCSCSPRPCARRNSTRSFAISPAAGS